MNKRKTGVDIVVYILMIVNTLMYLQEVRLSHSLSINNSVLIAMGANNYGLIFGQHQYLRLFMSMFLHMSLIHIASNMISLWYFSRMTSGIYNWFEFSLIYFVGGIFGNYCATIMQPNIISAGASVSIMAVLGGIMAFFFLPRSRYSPKSIVQEAVVLLLLNSVGMIGTNVDIAAHVMGFVGGLVIGTVIILLKRITKQV